MSERYVSLQDICPTPAELCRLKPPAYLDGRSLVPLLKDANAKWESTVITCLSEKNSPDQGYIIIHNELGRYIRYGDGQEEFYDTTQDQVVTDGMVYVRLPCGCCNSPGVESH